MSTHISTVSAKDSTLDKNVSLSSTNDTPSSQLKVDSTTPDIKPSTKIHLIAGASAGLISAVTLQPFDLLKTRLQQQQEHQFGYRTTILKELRKLTKIKDLWRGALPSTLRTSIGAGLYFTILSKSRIYIASLKTSESEISNTSALPKLSHMENLTTGFIVRAIVGLVTMPVTIMKTRYESNLYNYNSMYEGFENIYSGAVIDKKGTPIRGESPTTALKPIKGSFKNFFKGSYATLARDCPYAGLYVLFYESFKNDLLPKVITPFEESIDENPSSFGITTSTLINTTSAILAASVSTTITAPFDAIKTRLQLTSIHIPVENQPKTLWQTTKVLVKEEGGIKNLFRGLSLRFGRKGLSAGISWCIYEELIKSKKLSDLVNPSEKVRFV